MSTSLKDINLNLKEIKIKILIFTICKYRYRRPIPPKILRPASSLILKKGKKPVQLFYYTEYNADKSFVDSTLRRL
jgi:hypothetical protein